jgi:hypothetical protein
MFYYARARLSVLTERVLIILVVTSNLFIYLFISHNLSLPTHCRCRGLLLHLVTLNDAHSVLLLWMRDRPVPDTST